MEEPHRTIHAPNTPSSAVFKGGIIHGFHSPYEIELPVLLFSISFQELQDGANTEKVQQLSIFTPFTIILSL